MAVRRFFMLRGDPTVTLPALVKDTGAALLVTDFGPLRLGREWRSKVKYYEQALSVCWAAIGHFCRFLSSISSVTERA